MEVVPDRIVLPDNPATIDPLGILSNGSSLLTEAAQTQYKSVVGSPLLVTYGIHYQRPTTM